MNQDEKKNIIIIILSTLFCISSIIAIILLIKWVIVILPAWAYWFIAAFILYLLLDNYLHKINTLSEQESAYGWIMNRVKETYKACFEINLYSNETPAENKKQECKKCRQSDDNKKITISPTNKLADDKEINHKS